MEAGEASASSLRKLPPVDSRCVGNTTRHLRLVAEQKRAATDVALNPG